MKTKLIIIAAALISGAAYGQAYAGDWFADFQRQIREREYQAQVQEQLEEIRAAQRQAEYYRQQEELDYGLRLQREQYFRQYLEDCE